MTTTQGAKPRERVLCVIDRAYRGAVEVQFFHPLYGLLDLHGQFERVDLALRGATVTMAVEESVYVPSVTIGSMVLDTLPDYRGSVRDLIAAGFEVFVDEEALDRLGVSKDRLVPGVTCIASADLAVRWPEYDQVWFV
ncbi:hypothetical protein ACIGJO_30515 [Streptomyces sp. NPDC079020]|uniref:hypothetical protein n=1 Tax=Streptomyces sp. NPDC079020 TaxID=3365722 RepID=UPI0037D974B1